MLWCSFVKRVDHVYVICMKCEQVEIPASWLGKVTLVHGDGVDACSPDLPDSHWRRATVSHAVWRCR